jgi:hypothetical protein
MPTPGHNRVPKPHQRRALMIDASPAGSTRIAAMAAFAKSWRARA